jgi:prephenate dehydrogenase
MWRGIMEQNRSNLINDVDELMRRLEEARKALAQGDSGAVESILRSGNQRREAWLEGMEGNA